MMVDFATIQVHKETKERIAALREPGESYDATLRRIVEADIKRREAEFFAELDEMAADEDAFVPLDDVWPSSS